MTPEYKIKKTILLSAAPNTEGDLGKTFPISLDMDEVEVELIWNEFEELRYLQDYLSEFRAGDCETEIKPDWSRHYESRSVASKMFDGSWVGWTYWYGGGRHGEPESISWISDSYNLNCKEEEKTVVVRIFDKVVDYKPSA